MVGEDLFNKNFLDRFTSVDERQAETNKLLRELITVLKAQPRLPAAPVVAPGGPADRELITPTLELVLLDDIARGVGTLVQVLAGVNLTERIDISIQYPSDGETKTVDKGDVVVNVFEGTVQLPDGTKEELSDSLKAHDKLFARSFNIKTSKAIKYALDNGGFYPIGAGDSLGETFQNLQILRLKILEDSTKISLWFCSNPQALKQFLGVADIGTPSTTTEAYGRTLVGTTAVELRGANSTRHQLAFRNKHASGTIYFGGSSAITATDNAGYLKPDDAFTYDLGNLYRGALYVISDTSDTPVHWQELG